MRVLRRVATSPVPACAPPSKCSVSRVANPADVFLGLRIFHYFNHANCVGHVRRDVGVGGR